MLIDRAYFKASITIGGISVGNSPVVGDTVNDTFIPFYEDDYLQKALGFPLYKVFTEAIGYSSETPPDDEDINQIWLDLRDGVGYEVNGKAYRWGGFINDLKKSPIAYYVYCEYMAANAVQTTATGTGVNNKKNLTSVSPAEKISVAWVDMKCLNANLWFFLQNKKDVYTDYDSCRVDWDALLGSRNAFGI